MSQLPSGNSLLQDESYIGNSYAELMQDPALQFLLRPKTDYVYESGQRGKRLSTIHELPSFTPITPKSAIDHWSDQNKASDRMERSHPKTSGIAELGRTNMGQPAQSFFNGQPKWRGKSSEKGKDTQHQVRSSIEPPKTA